MDAQETSTGAGSRRATRAVGRDLAAALLGTAAVGLPVFLVGTMAVEMRASLHFGASGLGLAVSGYYLGAAVCSVPGSRLAEAIGGGRVMRLMLVVSGAVQFALAGGASSWASLSILLFVAGALSGAMSPATNLFLARRSAQERQGFVFGLKQAAVPLSSLLGGLAVPAIALSVGWRWAFVAGGLLTLVGAWLVPASRTSLADRRKQRQGQARPAVGMPPLVVLGIAFGLGVFAASACTAFLVSSAVRIGFSTASAGLLAALAGVAAFVSRIATGYQADRRGRRHLPVVAMMLAVGAAGYASLAAASASGDRALFAASAVVALTAGWGWNGLLNFAVVRTHAHAPAIATGVTQVGARLGGVVGPLLVGVAVAHGSYTDGWALAALAALGSAGAVLVARRLLVRASAARLGADPAVGPGDRRGALP